MNTKEHSAINENFLMVPCLVMVDTQAMLIGINAQKIISVVDYEHISCLPVSHLPFIGLYDHHQEAIPVMDLSLVLKQPDMNLAQSLANMSTASLPDNDFMQHVEQMKRYNQTKIIICQLLNMVVGILVHATYRIESLKNSQIISVPKILENSEFCMLNGLFHYRNQFLYLLDLEGILARLGLLNIPEPEEVPKPSTSTIAGKTVLVVDDAKVFRVQVTKLLSAHGVHCIEAVDGQDGYEKFMQQPEQFDLIFTDFEMPRMGGLEMARKIRQEASSSIPVIFNSSISNPSLIAEISAEYGCFLVKFQPEEIIKKLNELLA